MVFFLRQSIAYLALLLGCSMLGALFVLSALRVILHLMSISSHAMSLYCQSYLMHLNHGFSATYWAMTFVIALLLATIHTAILFFKFKI